ncbi:MAG: sialate O-acetylesterase [Candidatus Acidiferrales bacterium]
MKSGKTQFVGGCDRFANFSATAAQALGRILLRACLLAVALASFAFTIQAEPLLPHLFSDHMVLQRNMKIPVWGMADPGEDISVTLAGESARTNAGRDGRWKISLAPMAASGPFELTVHGKTTIRFVDVMVGEVWLASGQSNMTFALSGSTGADAELARANNPGIRFFAVPGKIAMTPQSDTRPATWEICTPEMAKDFSAVSYYFAKKLHDTLQVPVGIILSAWPGTQAEEWTDVDSLEREPILRPILERWDAVSPEVKSGAEHGSPVELEFDDFELLPKQAVAEPEVLSNFDDGLARTSFGGDWTYEWKAAADSTFDLVAPGRGGTGFAARITGRLDGLSFPHLVATFHAHGAPADLRRYAGIRFWVRGSGSFQFHLLQPTIVDTDDYGSPTIHASAEWKLVTLPFSGLRQAGWGVVEPFTPEAITGISIVGMPVTGDPPRPPAGLYDGMIAPLEAYRIRGAIWYQGEGNTYHAYQYRTLLPALIQGWRKAWDEPDFPFLIVQLPNQGTSPELSDSIWAELREAQLMTSKSVPNTGLAVTIDVGEAQNLHPPRKREVGERLALWALGTTYGEKLVYSGPIYEKYEVEGNQIRIHFSHVGSGLEASDGGPLKGFTIAGADRKFHRADARIDGDTIVVSSPEVASPVSARYAWQDSPDCNFYNKDGLPASPFRTDDWPGLSFDKR